jgi:hypothetical protein
MADGAERMPGNRTGRRPALGSSAARQRARLRKLSASASEILIAEFGGTEYHRTVMRFDELFQMVTAGRRNCLRRVKRAELS